MRTYVASPLNRIAFHIRTAADADPERQKTKRQSNYEDFAECIEVIASHKAIVQSYRGGGAIIASAGKAFVTYHAEALWQFKPNQLLRISGDFSTREAQEEFLALLRTVNF
jgi:predicted ATP-binding protein involved in virulence